jgi:hypothetical protein
MKTKKMICMTAVIGMMFLVLSGGIGCSQSIQTRDGLTKTLHEVAVLHTSEKTCPIIRIDGVAIGEKYEEGNAYYLSPGEHTIQVVKTTGDCNTYCRIEFTDVKYDFQAQKVYAILRAEPTQGATAPEEGKAAVNAGQGLMPGFGSISGNYSQKPSKRESAPCVADQGDVVSFAAAHPDYCKDSPVWQKLRAENGMHPSFFERVRMQFVAWGFIKPKNEPIMVAEQKPVESF